ncbi:MAG: glycoside hydrolase family 140 protein [Anaerolineae bacterium]|nr:glycoside hydrolase family 140 protein [Anaerolineae bacterium]
MTVLRVSSNKRYLVDEYGRPFFYLGDTAWEIFHRLDRSEAEWFLRDRAAKGFTVVQSVVLAEEDGLNDPNPYGHRPLIDNDPTRPNEAYFEHVDYIVNVMASLGMWCGMLPTWGDKWNVKWGVGPEIFTPENARIYGEFLGRRYKEKPIIWILGGDRPVEKPEHRDILNAMAAGLRAGDEGCHLITFHPVGGRSSADDWHTADWLDFNMWQSGHTRNTPNWQCIARDYELTPTKPCMDGEPAYEDHPSAFDIENGYVEAYDNRKSLYWALFAGAHGHTYGCNPIWQFFTLGRNPKSFCRHTWQEAMSFPGSGQMQYAKRLIESRPFLSRIPDQSLIVGDAGQGTYRVQATRDADGSYAFIYCPTIRPVTVDLSKLSGDALDVHWYDPRTGAAHRAGRIKNDGPHEFTPPRIWSDWVLVLDDASAQYPTPGSARYA